MMMKQQPHYYIRLMAFFPGKPGCRYQKGRTILDFTEARDDWVAVA